MVGNKMLDKNNKKLLSEYDFEEYLKEIKKPWKTMNRDIDKALEIISRAENRSINPLLFSEQLDNFNDQVTVHFPNWHDHIEEHFIQQYGKEEGSAIYDKVVMQLYKTAKGERVYMH